MFPGQCVWGPLRVQTIQVRAWDLGGRWGRKKGGEGEPALLSWRRVFSVSFCPVADSYHSYIFITRTFTTLNILSHTLFHLISLECSSLSPLFDERWEDRAWRKEGDTRLSSHVSRHNACALIHLFTHSFIRCLWNTLSWANVSIFFWVLIFSNGQARHVNNYILLEKG